MKRNIWGLFILTGLLVVGTAYEALAQQHPPGLTVFGRGEVSATPDTAIVRLGAVAQAEKAGAAQDRVNAAVRGILKGIRALGIPEEKIATVQLTISPVYGPPPKGPAEEHREPAIIGYRAGNIVRVTVDDLKILGRVVDAGLTAGAMGVQLGGVRAISEGGVNVVRPQMMDAVAAYAVRDAAPIRPGQLQVEASLTVSYDIAKRALPAASPESTR